MGKGPRSESVGSARCPSLELAAKKGVADWRYRLVDFSLGLRALRLRTLVGAMGWEGS